MVLTEIEINKRVSDSYEVKNNVLEAVPTPLVSIRTSTYNHGPYIKQCIEGVLMQKTNFPFEYIIGEDCSTDETREIVFDYAKRYPNIIRVITANYNVGSKANGRRCINACRGKYMAICEGDDYWIDPYKLQKQVDFLEEHSEYSFSCTAFRFYYQKEGSFSDFSNKINCAKLTHRDLIIAILNKNSFRIQTNTVVFRKEIYLQLLKDDPFLYSSNYFLMGDTQLWVGLLSYGKLHYLNEFTAVYRIVAGSACRNSDLIQRYRFELSCWELRLYLFSKLRIRNIKLKIRFLMFYSYYLLLYIYHGGMFNPKFVPSLFCVTLCRMLASLFIIKKNIFSKYIKTNH